MSDLLGDLRADLRFVLRSLLKPPVLASLVPAIRATRVDPIDALRSE